MPDSIPRPMPAPHVSARIRATTWGTDRLLLRQAGDGVVVRPT